MSRLKYRKLPFAVKFPARMTHRTISAWIKTLNVLAIAVKENDIEIKKVSLHHHTRTTSKWHSGHPMGSADTDGAHIDLCSDDIDTALHEIAHIWTKQGHSPLWAEKWMLLQDKYITDKCIARKYYEDAVEDYRGVREFLGIKEKKVKPPKRIWFYFDGWEYE
jgi:hypothetical protein